MNLPWAIRKIETQEVIARTRDEHLAKELRIRIQNSDLLKVVKVDEALGDKDDLPHQSPEECPTYFDCCHCTVENLKHQMARAEAAEKSDKESIEMYRRARDRADKLKEERKLLLRLLKESRETVHYVVGTLGGESASKLLKEIDEKLSEDREMNDVE